MKSAIKTLVIVMTGILTFEVASADTRLLCSSIQKISSADGSFRAPLPASIVGLVDLNPDASFDNIRSVSITGPFFAKGDMVITAYTRDGKGVVFGDLHDNWHMFKIELKRNGAGQGALIVTDEGGRVRYPLNCSVRSFGAKASLQYDSFRLGNQKQKRATGAFPPIALSLQRTPRERITVLGRHRLEVLLDVHTRESAPRQGPP